jgi:uncharacterized membrane protein
MLIGNWLLYAYGMPLVLCAAMAWALYRIEPNRAKGRGFEIAAMIIAVLLVALQVRHGFQRGDMHVFGSMGLVEAATYGIAWLVMAIALFALDRRARREMWFQSGAIIAALAAMQIMVVVGLMENPLWVRFDLGSMKLLNWLLYAFGLPLLLMGTAARMAHITAKRESMRGLCVALYWVAFVLSFALVSLEVRHAFQGSIILAEQGLTPAENYTHTAAWLLYGAALLVLGIRLKQPIVRYVSLGVMILTVGKVFLWDMRQLRDLWRVFSFLGLGVSLLVLAYVYQRFVFRMRDGTTD